MKLIVVVEEAFTARGPGALVRPTIDADRVPSAAFDVAVRTPDGAERRTRAVLEVPHVRGPHAPKGWLRLADLAPEDLPAGTEIWG